MNCSDMPQWVIDEGFPCVTDESSFAFKLSLVLISLLIGWVARWFYAGPKLPVDMRDLAWYLGWLAKTPKTSTGDHSQRDRNMAHQLVNVLRNRGSKYADCLDAEIEARRPPAHVRPKQ